MSHKDDIIAIIMAGGRGKRLRPLTDFMQKVMLPTGRKRLPLLEYVINNIKKHGITNIILALGYKYDQVMEYFEDGSRWRIRIKYFVDKELRGTGYALLKIYEKGMIDDINKIIVYYGDILTNADLSNIIHFSDTNRCDVTIVASKGYKLPVGIITLDKDGVSVKELREKPIIDAIVGIGIFIFNNNAIKYAFKLFYKMLSDSIQIDISKDILPQLINCKDIKVCAYVLKQSEFWIDIGTLEIYENLDTEFIEKYFNRYYSRNSWLS